MAGVLQHVFWRNTKISVLLWIFHLKETLRMYFSKSMRLNIWDRKKKTCKIKNSSELQSHFFSISFTGGWPNEAASELLEWALNSRPHLPTSGSRKGGLHLPGYWATSECRRQKEKRSVFLLSMCRMAGIQLGQKLFFTLKGVYIGCI